ncbi:MAG TPA: DUF5329 family protein [Verrucomicrobiales bacterium]|nr:DUF5329 family protein [Verrucomicrobiales bacterium]
MKLRVAFIILLTGFLAGGCSKKPSSATSAAAAATSPPLASVPVEFTAKQRSTTAVPGSGDVLQLTIDDITRGQTVVSMAGKNEEVILARRSMHKEGSVHFKFGGEALTLTLKDLNNALIGEDFASFAITRSTAKSELAEDRKIALLIEHVKQMEGATFIRNGSEHSPKDAAEHLSTKLAAAGKDDLTAREFIDNIASKSSLSDEVYTIRLADGTTVPSGEYLTKELAKIEAPPSQNLTRK